MTALALVNPVPQFFDLDGSPLQSGSIYIGTANLNPITSPGTVYWDAAATQPAAQPIQTSNGYPVRAGTPAAIFANGDVSMLVLNSSGQQVLYSRNSADVGSAATVQAGLSALIADLASAAVGKGSKLLAYILRMTGAVARWVEDKLSETPSVMDFGAAGDGITDDTAAFVLAQAAIPAGGSLLLPPGKTYKVGTVNWTGKAVTVMGYGATVLCTSATGAFYKTDHGNKLTIAGVKFTSTTAGARAVNHQSAQDVSVYDELQLDDCSFTMNGAYGLYLVGTREPRINSCTFFDTNGGDGVYCKDTAAPSFNDCLFKGSNYTRRGFYYPGTGTAFDASPMLFNCEIMGWDVGLEVVGCDSMVIIGGTFDYCNWTMKIASQDGGKISKAYIGSLAANPGVWITSDASATSPDHCEKLVFESCTFTGHYSGGATYDNVLIDGGVSSDHLRFDNCFFTFYTRYGLQFTTTGRLSVSTCTFVPRATFGVAPIYNATGIGDSGVIIKQNIFPSGTTVAAMNLNFAAINENYACATEGRGEAFVGSGVSTYNQAHGLAYTPAKSDVQLTATNSEAAGKNPFVSSVDATNIVIGFTSATAATAGVAWRVRRGS